MTTEEKKMMQQTNEIVCDMIKQRNAGTQNCRSTTELAREIGIHTLDLNHFLLDVGVLYRERGTGELKLTAKFQERGLSKKRSCFRYGRNGKLREIVYPVWTEKGEDFILNLIQGKRLKEKETNNKNNKDYDKSLFV